MSKTNVKSNNVSGLRIAVMIISILLLSCIMAFSMILGISSLKRNAPVTIGEDATTVRKKLPGDGTLPTDASPIDNIGYMAYVMDNQPLYHSYAYNSTKSTGYEQVTQSWKDYIGTGEGPGIMVASDLSYSQLVKSATQSCFINGTKALIRNGNKPSSKNATPLNIEWATGKPSIYDKKGYKYVYGEFSTEISVYVINEDTLTGADPVVVNDDGTYSQKYYLNENAGVWYQYGMKTRGGLKNYPEFKRIEITFTFDKNWQIIRSYCEEKATISPRALGGMNMGSDSKTTTIYDYTEKGFKGSAAYYEVHGGDEDFDCESHYAFYENFFKQYQDAAPGENEPEETGPEVLDVLGGGFSKVVSEEGQQFKIAITLGETKYDGKVYLKLANLSDVLGSLDARVSLEKRDSGRQDFYAEFREGKINVYYSTGFALTADIDSMSASVKNIIDWVNGLNSKPATQSHAAKSGASYALAAGEAGGGLDISALVNDLKLEIKDEEAFIKLQSENLLGLGIGADVVFGFDRIREEDGDLFAIKSLDLNYISYKGTPVDLKAEIVPDDSGEEVIRKEQETTGNLADYVNSVFDILNHKTVKIDIDVDETLVEGLALEADAYLSIGSNIAANLAVSAAYDGASITLEATYVYSGSSYGKVYLHVTEINGTEVDAKVCCDIGDAVKAVKSILAVFDTPDGDDTQVSAAQNTLARIINNVLNLNFSEVIKKIENTSDTLTLGVNVDALLKGLGVSIGIDFGDLLLTIDSANGKITGSLSSFGLGINIEGSDEELPLISDTDSYVDISDFLTGIETLVSSEIYEINLDFTGGEVTDDIDLSGLIVKATAYAKLENGYNNITVNVPILISYCGLEVELTAYYSADLKKQDYSTVYLELKRIDDTLFNAKVYCDIKEAIAAVKDIIDAFKAPAAAVQSDEGSSDIISKVVGLLLNLDYAEMIKGTKDSLSVTLNVDDVLAAFDIDLGVTFGDLQLDLTLDGEKGAVLCGKLETLGAQLTLSGNDTYAMPAAPDKNDYLDITQAIKLAGDMVNEGKKIADAKDIVFLIDGVIDGIDAELHGNGEVVWADDTIKVGISLTVKVDGETLDINFVYDAAESDPLVIITINEIGTTISRAEIDKLVKSFKGLIDAFTKNDSTGTDSGNTGSGDTNGDDSAAVGYALQVGDRTLDEILGNENVKKALNAILGFVNDFTVEIQTVDAENAIYNVLIKRSDGMQITLGADGCLSLGFEKAGKFALNANVEAGNGSTVSAMRSELLANADGKYTYYELSEFVNELYKSIFDRLEEISLKKLLGDAYRVTLNLTGKNSDIGALEGIEIRAELYYDEGVVGTSRETKLVQADLYININGTLVNATAAYHGRTVFVELKNIGATTLTGIKFKTDVDNIFDAAEQLIRFVTDTNLADTIGRFTGNTPSAGDVETIAAFADLTDKEGNPAPSTLTKIIDAILGLNFEKAFKFDKDTNTAEINVDSLAKALLGFEIGTIKATFDSENHTLDASVKLEEKEAWLTLEAASCAFKSDAINPDDYLDIGFVSTMLSDIVKTVTDGTDPANKRVYDLYTFVGSIAIDVNDIPVLGSLKIRFNNATLTAGLDSNDKFYITLAASMQKSTALGFVQVTANKDISITYSDGLIVLGSDIGTSKEAYKVMTLEYLLDNLMDKDNSPVQWWLGTDKTVWGILADRVNLGIDSGLTKPRTYTLYDQLAKNEKEGKFDLSDYLSGMIVKTGDGEPLFTYNGGAPLATSKFSLENDNNHYAIDINARELTNGTLSALCAVLLRGNDGITGIKAYANISSMVDITLDFGTYRKGVTETYGGRVLELLPVSGTLTADDFYDGYAVADDVTAENVTNYYTYDEENGFVQAETYEKSVTYFKKVTTKYYLEDGTLATVFNSNTQYYEYVERDSTSKLGEVAVQNYLAHVTKTYNFDRNQDFGAGANHVTPIFGCFTIEGGKSTYASSNVLETIYLDVYAGIGETVPERTLEVLYGSTVLLVSDFPEFANAERTRKLIYVDANEENLHESIIIDDDHVSIVYDSEGKGRVSIYKSSESAIEVEFHFVGISGMNPVSAAFAVGDTLKEYPLHGYSFLGWFKEESFTTQVKTLESSDVEGKTKITLYGKYVKALIEAENGVNYAFDAEVDGYYVVGVNKAIKEYYNNKTKWLEIASYINGYPVVYIGPEAFLNAEKDVANSLVNVVIPDTIDAIYDKAFFDNKGLEKVVICGDNVFFGGRADGNDASRKTTVFYGCYPGKESNNDSFKVYYNGTLAENPHKHVTTLDNALDTNGWFRIYFKKPVIGGNTTYKMQTQSGGWAFVRYEVTAEGIENYPYLAELNLFNDGVSSVETTKGQIEDTVLAGINSRTATNDKFIDGFGVTVVLDGKDTEKTVFGKCTVVRIGIAPSTPKYLINYHATCDGAPDDGAAYISGLTPYGNNNYATAGDTYFIVANAGYEITSVSGVEYTIEDGQYSFVMPSGFTEIDINTTRTVSATITLISDVNFTYGNAEVKSENGKFKAEIDADVATLGTPDVQEANYVFVGWTYKTSETNYVFADGAVDRAEYYAVWAYKRTEISSLSASGKTLTAAVDSSKANSVYGWYADANFSGAPIALCGDGNSATLTAAVSSTIIHARMNYSVTINTSVNGNTDWYYSRGEGDNIVDMTFSTLGKVQNGTKFASNTSQYAFAGVVEGCKVEVYRYWKNALIIKIYGVEGNCLETYEIKAQQTNKSKTFRELLYDSTHYFVTGDGTWDLNNDSDNKSSNSSTVYYKEYDSAVDDSGRIIGTVNSTGTNLSFTCVS